MQPKPMKRVRQFPFIAAGIATICLSACSGMKVTHVRPGQSARAALAAGPTDAQPADALPVPETGTPALAAEAPGGQAPPTIVLPGLPANPGPLPTGSANAESVADAYTRGTFAMQAGQNAEAIAALEEAVNLDPDFTDAWGKLAILYQKEGNTAKATEAFKKAKRLGDANGGTVTRDAAGGLQFP
jgi:hypothetical protein